MDVTVTPDQADEAFSSLLGASPVNVPLALEQIRAEGDAAKRNRWTDRLIRKLADIPDFRGLYGAVKDRRAALPPGTGPGQIREMFSKACRNRTDKAFLAAADFGGKPSPDESFRRFDLLASLKPGDQVIDSAWGFGLVKRIDDFYSRVIIDFRGEPNHALSFATVCETLAPAPEGHLFSVMHNDPGRIWEMVAKNQGELVKLTLASLGDMPALRLEKTLEKLGLVPAGGWKKFWDAARKALKSDPLVEVPARRADNIRLRAEAESYGDAWFARLAKNRDPRDILKEIDEFEDAGKLPGLSDTERGVIEERLSFAVTGAFNTDPALFARLSAAVSRLGFITPPLDRLRAHLWDQKRYIRAAAHLPVKDVRALAQFLLAGGGDAKELLLGDLPEMPYALLNEVMQALKETPESAAACARLLAQPKAPPTLVLWLFRFRKALPWEKKPSLIDLLNHGVAIVDTPFSGEGLRMQNGVKELFASADWIQEVFEELTPGHRRLLFERVQASHGWDAAAHRSLLRRMLKADPALSGSRKAEKAKAREAAPMTSWRSLKERQNAFRKLVEVDLPKNSADIAAALSYGDLSENFEYQAAKDQQRLLLQRQTELQRDLRLVKGTDFADAPAGGAAGPGATVTIRLEGGETRRYTILGEWDSDETLGIISNRTRMAQALKGKKPGDAASVPGADGPIPATVEKVEPIDAAIRAWIAADPE